VEDDRAEFVDNMVVKGIVSQLKAADNLESARAFIKRSCVELGPHFKSEALRGEVAKLMQIAFVHQCNNEEVEVVAKVKKEFISNQALKLQQALVFFPTGKALVDAVDVEENSIHKDKLFAESLKSASLKLKGIESPEDNFVKESDSEGTVAQFSKEFRGKLEVVAGSYNNIKGNASQRFMASSMKELDLVAAALFLAADSLHAKIKLQFASLVSTALTSLSENLQPPFPAISGTTKSGIALSFTVAINVGLPIAEHTCLKTFAPETAKHKHDAWQVGLVGECVILKNCVQALFDGSPSGVMMLYCY
jgi:hypothetical protein